MTLPVRASVRVTRFAVRTGLTFSVRALTAATDAVSSLTGRGTDGASAWPAPEPPARNAENGTEPPAGDADNGTEPPAQADIATHAAPDQLARREDPPSPPSPLVEEPAHVSEEPVVVEEFAEPGAEEGAGASVTVDEPWDGYARMTARDITARLGDASLAELAAVQLYESTHKQRETVLAAAQRELRTKSAPGATG
ncbi:MAG: hypothetical protein ACJ76X_13355 [Solirubrobacteraceae bacterium]